MPQIPTKGMTRAYEALKDTVGWRRVGSFALEHTDARSWELYHYGGLLLAIDFRGRCEAYTPDGSFSTSDRDAVNSLGLLVLGWKPLPTFEELRRAESKGEAIPHARVVVTGEGLDDAESDGCDADD